MKATFLKHALCVSKTTPSHLVFVSTKESFYIEDLCHQLLLPLTETYNFLIREQEDKAREIWPDFYATDAMLYTLDESRVRSEANSDSRMAIHGYHHLLCKTEIFHHPMDMCVCMCVCVCVCVCICVYVCIPAHTCVCVCVYVCVHICMRARVCVCYVRGLVTVTMSYYVSK